MKSPQNLAGLERLIADAGGASKGVPPVEKWSPPFCGDLDMEIAADGLWYYLGTPIGRPALVKLFASVLRKDDDGKTYLVTPVEKIGIRVQDAHFVAVGMAVDGKGDDQVITLRTNVDDVVTVGPDNPMRFELEAGTMGVKPYVHVRGQLEALVKRALMYDIVALGEHLDVGGTQMFAVRSSGMVFPIMESAALAKALA